MNIVITLPSNLIQDIMDGKKQVEVRTRNPQRFNPDKDVVWVIEKGTKSIPIMFSIRRFVFYSNWHDSFTNLKEPASVNGKWLYNYCIKHQTIVSWEIGRICEVKFPDNTYKWLGIKTNPLSFSYNDIDEERIPIKKAYWCKKVPYEERELVFMPDKRRDYINAWLNSDTDIYFHDWCFVKQVPENCIGKAVQ